MNDFKELYSLAEVVNGTQSVKQMEKTAQRLENQEFTKIVVTGMKSSGKTTFINSIVGVEVREPGNLEEYEKPLRVNFEEMEEEDGIQCVLEVNHEWNQLSAVIYEFNQEDMMEENRLNTSMYEIDLVFFLISALAPFKYDEVNYLKALAPLKRQVIVTGMEYVKETDREKVRDYINKNNASFGLPPVLFLEKGQDCGRIVRNIVPGYLEVKEDRNIRIRNLYRNAAEWIEKEIKKKLEEQKVRAEQNKEQLSELSLEAKRQQADCYTVRMDIDSWKRRAVEGIKGGNDSQVEAMVSRVMKEAGTACTDEKVYGLAEKEYDKAAKAAVRKLHDSYIEDLAKADSAAGLLQIPGWNDSVRQELKGYAPEYDGKKLMQDKSSKTAEGKGLEGMESLESRSAEHVESTRLLIGTGLAVGGFALAPLPAIISYAGGIAAAGIGSVSYIKKRKEEEEAALEMQLKRIFREGVVNLNIWIQENADFCYGKISEKLLEIEKKLKESKEQDISQKEETERLEKILEQCKVLKEETGE